ncbi:MAG: hypothetical protein IKZ87_06850, partial [Actinomycetaceae bacterium]|nr:hypothetical protein [Actinomycetaceae bacterium]
LTIRYYDKADHGLQVGDHILLLSAMQDVADWASGLPYTAHSSPSVAGAQPTQTYAADMVARTYWFASGKIGLYIPLIALLILFLSLIASALYSFIGILQRKTGRSGKEHLPVPIARMNIASIMLILALVGLLAYVFSVAYLATNYTHNVLITYGGWVVIRVLALVAAWLSLLAFSRFLHSYKSGGEYSWGTAPFAMVGVTFFGQLTLLMSLAYWGVFPSLI